MPRYVALLRGVSPMNLKMADLARCVENAGFMAIKTILSSGNVAFDGRTAAPVSLERKLEAAMQRNLGRTFMTIVRSTVDLQTLLDSDPWAALRVPAKAKRVVTFLRETPQAKLKMPIEVDGACIHAMRGREVFITYLPNPRGPVFMKLIEDTFGKSVTTRTWDTIARCARA